MFVNKPIKSKEILKLLSKSKENSLKFVKISISLLIINNLVFHFKIK